MLFLRAKWICGLLSTGEYDLQSRTKRFGAGAVPASEPASQRLERSLLEDRLAVVIFLFAALILAYTFLNAPGLA
jgi:hypothetical protein